MANKDLLISAVNESYIKIESDKNVALDLKDYFTFKVDGYQYTPAYKKGWWDGTIRLFNVKNRQIYRGLLSRIIEWADDRNLTYELSNELVSNHVGDPKKLEEFANSVIPEHLEKRDYQIEAFQSMVNSGRLTLLSPTSSGKSLLIYLIIKYFNTKTLLVVDSISLLNQMEFDLKSYGFDIGSDLHKVVDKQKDDPNKQVILTTWQSVYKLPEDWFNQFDMVVFDEVHKAKATCLKGMMEKCTSVKLRFGLTGTLGSSHTNRLVIEGLFGPVNKVTTTRELIDNNYSADLKIRCVNLVYPEGYRKVNSKLDYESEISLLVENKQRNTFIRKLVTSLDGNTLVLFWLVDRHGKLLYEDIKSHTDKPVYFISGDTEGEDRERFRLEIDTLDSSILVASSGTFSTGVNLPNINNVVFAHPWKAQIRVLQSIGRGLRKSGRKSTCNLYDISDDLSWKSKKNHTLKHFLERLKIYGAEAFDYKIYKVKLK